jgi:hypothetical protein
LKKVTRSLVFATLLSLLISNVAKAEKEASPTMTTAPPAQVVLPPVKNKVKTTLLSYVNPALAVQLKTGKVGSVPFWEAVSWCETNHDWKNNGYYAGGLGMAQSAWRGYGGWEFAKSPKNATKEEQIIVANRVAFLGYQTKDVFITFDDRLNNKPFFRPAVGWRNSQKWGKTCVNWKTREPGSYRFTEAGMAKFEVTNPNNVARSKVDSAGVRKSSVSTNSCPQWEAKLKQYGLPVKEFSRIMYRESRCQPKAIGWNYHKGTSYKDCKLSPASTYKRCKAVRSYDSGLLQINSSWVTVVQEVCHSKRGNMNVLLDYRCNLKVAKYLLNNGGMGHWSGTSGKK